MADTAAVLRSSPSALARSSPSESASTEDTPSIRHASTDNLSQVPSNRSASLPHHHNFPPPKTDKPRPHVCATCTRSFARLEHLKRHERSHTKEKPFECPECTRCFARRDLLLRHQQKLHSTTTPSSRSRGGRRESASGGTSGRVRKNSVSSSVSGVAGAISGHKPRANTISHVDGGTLGMLAAANRSANNIGLNEPMPSLVKGGHFDIRGMSSASGHHGNPHMLPRLATQGHHLHLGGDLRTAPPMQSGSFDFEHGFAGASTINPAQLHMPNSAGFPPSPFANTPTSPYNSHPPIMEHEENFAWMHGFQTQMSFEPGPEQSIGVSSPEQPQFVGNGLPFREDGLNQTMDHTGMIWSNGLPNTQVSSPVQMDASISTYAAFDPITHSMSPESYHTGNAFTEGMYAQPIMGPAMPISSHEETLPAQYVPHQAFSDGTSASSTNGSARQSSVTSVSTDSITETTRTALLLSLAQPPAFGSGHKKYAQPAISSPLSTSTTIDSTALQSSIPSTYDLQRFVGAYIQFFHPHFPFLHIATLSFDTPTFASDIKAPSIGPGGNTRGDVVGGGGCLILAMAAIGALYEFDRSASKELFEAAKRMITLYLEERRTADQARSQLDAANSDTPLWLVQAMLLNVIYGHNCGDKTSGEIASRHCTALVGLARATGLTRPYIPRVPFANCDIKMEEVPGFGDPFAASLQQHGDEQSQWFEWIIYEERKRTLFALFHMSSLLTASYNHAPALSNSEVRLELPCEEELWTAPTASVWTARRMVMPEQGGCIPFATALSSLLCASQNDTSPYHIPYARPFGSSMPLEEVPTSDLKPSTFGCLVLINALHNYIWETRQRHMGQQWTTQETESMHAHIEPALRAWQSAWVSNPAHSIARPNPHGLGPLSADSIPLLDLAYVRLFVNLGTSKEAFWQRDFDGMAEELAHGAEIVQHAEHSEEATGAPNSASSSRKSPNRHDTSPYINENSDTDLKPSCNIFDNDLTRLSPSMAQSALPYQHQPHLSNKRERHLRRAAFYAADSLAMSDALGITFADFTSRELPVQSAMCTFDCAQILAEWVATVQERVGSYLGVLGRDVIDYQQVPATMLLDDEDCKLLVRISEILGKAGKKMQHWGMMENGALGAGIEAEGFGSSVLRCYAFMLERAAVWPVTVLMAEGLMRQADHMGRRAEASTAA